MAEHLIHAESAIIGTYIQKYLIGLNLKLAVDDESIAVIWANHDSAQ